MKRAGDTLLEACREGLARHGYRPTQLRLAVYRALCASPDHPTADEVFHRLRHRHPRASLASVYNSLEALGRSGLIRRLNEPVRAGRYDTVMKRHHHLVCRRCGTVRDLHDEALDGVRPGAAAEGFQVDDLSVHFYGTCAACQEERDPPNPRRRT